MNTSGLANVVNIKQALISPRNDYLDTCNILTIQNVIRDILMYQYLMMLI